MSVAQTARDHRVTLARALRSEGIKLAGLRATKWLIGAALVAPFLITLIWASAASGPVDAAAVLDTATPSSFATFIILILVGIMTATSDYESNAAVQTYSVVPARTPVVLAKYTLVAAIALAVSLVTSVGTFALADVLRGGGLDAWSPEVIRVLLDLALAETCGALIGVAAGLIVRSSIGALGVVLGFFYLVPLILGLIPVGCREPAREDHSRRVPHHAGLPYERGGPARPAHAHPHHRAVDGQLAGGRGHHCQATQRLTPRASGLCGDAGDRCRSTSSRWISGSTRRRGRSGRHRGSSLRPASGGRR